TRSRTCAPRAECLRQGRCALCSPPRRSSRRPSASDVRPLSFDRDGGLLGGGESVVAGPFELERAARGCHRAECDERIGRDRRMELGADDLLPVVGAHEQADDVARDRLAHVVVAEAGFHLVRDQRLDRDDLALLGRLRHINERARHYPGSSRQAAMVTITSTSSDQKLPSLSSATANTRCESASRMRVESLPCPARGPRRALITLGSGFFSLKMWIALTWFSGVIGLSTDTSSETVLPFSTSGGRLSVTLPLRSGAEPTTFLIAASIDAGVARAGDTDTKPAPAARLAAPISTLRRVVMGSVVLGSSASMPLPT